MEATGPTAPDAKSVPWWKSDFFFVLATVAVTLALAWAMARHELVRRAQEDYLEGEKYYSWYLDPAKKKAYLDAELAAGHLNQDQHDLQMGDNDLKNAYVWYESALDLCQPPRSEWTEKSEARMREVKPQYDAWLRSLGIEPIE
jgi:hypothetical protein